MAFGLFFDWSATVSVSDFLSKRKRWRPRESMPEGMRTGFFWKRFASLREIERLGRPKFCEPAMTLALQSGASRVCARAFSGSGLDSDQRCNLKHGGGMRPSR